MKIDAYLNLNDDCVSIRSREPEDYGTVVSHEQKVTIRDVEFVVQPAGQEKVRASGTKNVHAFVRGEWDDSINLYDTERVTYNPYEYDYFYQPDRDRYVQWADACIVSTKGVFAKGLSGRGSKG